MQIHTATCPTCPCVYRWEWSIKFGEGQVYWWCPILVESRSNRRLLLGWIINHLVMLESNIGIITTSRFYNLNTQCRLPSFIELNLYIKLIHFACIEVANLIISIFMTKKNFGCQRRGLYISLHLINYHYNIMVNEMKPNKNLISLKSQPLYG